MLWDGVRSTPHERSGVTWLTRKVTLVHVSRQLQARPSVGFIGLFAECCGNEMTGHKYVTGGRHSACPVLVIGDVNCSCVRHPPDQLTQPQPPKKEEVPAYSIVAASVKTLCPGNSRVRRCIQSERQFHCGTHALVTVALPQADACPVLLFIETNMLVLGPRRQTLRGSAHAESEVVVTKIQLLSV